MTRAAARPGIGIAGVEQFNKIRGSDLLQCQARVAVLTRRESAEPVQRLERDVLVVIVGGDAQRVQHFRRNRSHAENQRTRLERGFGRQGFALSMVGPSSFRDMTLSARKMSSSTAMA